MVNILYIINGWPSGGIAEQVYLLCKYLPKDEFKQYSIGYCHFNGAFVKKFENVGVSCIKSDEEYSNLEEIIRKYNIHVVHKQTGGGDCPKYVKLLKNIDIPLIESLHCPRASVLPIDDVSKIIYTTPYTFYKNSTRHQKKMISIQYALDLDGPVIDKKIYKDKERIIVGRLGRIVPDKRPDVLLELAEMSYKEFGDKIQFHIAGMIPQDYPFHIEYGKRFLEKVEKMPNMQYFGYVEDKYEFWKTLDICINPVWETSFDIVFLEAMACGLPILTWDNSAAKYVVGNSGFIAEENTKALYCGLKELYKSSALRQKMGGRGIEQIKTKYSLINFIEQYKNLYESFV